MELPADPHGIGIGVDQCLNDKGAVGRATVMTNDRVQSRNFYFDLIDQVSGLLVGCPQARSLTVLTASCLEEIVDVETAFAIDTNGGAFESRWHVLKTHRTKHLLWNGT